MYMRTIISNAKQLLKMTGGNTPHLYRSFDHMEGMIAVLCYEKEIQLIAIWEFDDKYYNHNLDSLALYVSTLLDNYSSRCYCSFKRIKGADLRTRVNGVRNPKPALPMRYLDNEKRYNSLLITWEL